MCLKWQQMIKACSHIFSPCVDLQLRHIIPLQSTNVHAQYTLQKRFVMRLHLYPKDKDDGTANEGRKRVIRHWPCAYPGPLMLVHAHIHTVRYSTVIIIVGVGRAVGGVTVFEQFWTSGVKILLMGNAFVELRTQLAKGRPRTRVHWSRCLASLVEDRGRPFFSGSGGGGGGGVLWPRTGLLLGFIIWLSRELSVTQKRANSGLVLKGKHNSWVWTFMLINVACW